MTGLLTLAIVALLALSVSSASAARNHVFDHAFGEPGSGAGQLSEPAGVAINETTGVVYVVDQGNNRVERFDGETGAFLGEFSGTATPAGSFEAPEGIAVDNVASSLSFGDVYVVDVGHRVIDKFEADGTYLGQITGTCPAPGSCLPGEVILFGEQLPGVAIDQTGSVWVYQSDPEVGHAEIDKFTNALGNEFVEAHEVEELGGLFPGLAVNSAEALYANTFFQGVVKLSSTGEVLTKKIGGGSEPASGLAIDRNSNDLYIGRSTEISILSPSLSPVEQFGSPDLTASAGIAVDASTRSVYVADPAAGRVAVFSLEPVAAPLIGSTSVTAVTATSASLQAEINPRSLPGEAPTTYHFEYDTTPYAEGEAAHGTPVPAGQISAGFGLKSVSAPIGALQPNTTYHYRVVATNSLGTVLGPDRSFTTQGAAATLLPDNRGWELVSPPEKHGAALEAISDEGGLIQAATDGSAITYFASGPPDSEPAGTRSVANTQLLSARATAGGWSTADLATPHQAPAGLQPGNPSEYKLFSSDLTLAALQPEGATPLSPLATEKTPYLRAPDGTYTPLVTAANVPADVHFGGTELSPETFAGSVTFQAASSDLSHLLLSSPQPLTAGFGTQPAGNSIFEWSAGALQLASLIPSAPASVCGGTGPGCAPAAEAGFSASVGLGNEQVRGAISTDGSRVVFTTSDGFEKRLYLRDLARQETVQLDAAEPACLAALECESGPGIFQIASADGSRVFFTDANRLTAASTAANGKPDLYMCQIEVDGSGHLACALTDLTANPAEPADVQGAVIGASADGSALYFVANGALTAGEGAVHGGTCGFEGASDSCNLYRYDTATATTRLIAVLSGADFPDWALEGTNFKLLTARVSPNGRYLAFMSQRPLTGYDNRDARSGERDEEVFLYDAQAPAAEALHCASCNPTGARPRGIESTGGFPGLLVDRPHIWGVDKTSGKWLAANLPGWTTVGNHPTALYQSRYLSNSGRLFFNAADALVPQDSNGVMDVYEYEPPQGPGQIASNSCTTASSIYSPASGGCVSLISSGTSPEESAFVDASESGDDVFFLTQSRLAGKDVDTALDLYDARVGGGEREAVKPVECSGDACQQPAVPPNHPTPGTALVNGPGNVLECPKGKVKKSGKCVKKHAKKHKKAHKKHHQAKHKRAANTNRRASR